MRPTTAAVVAAAALAAAFVATRLTLRTDLTSFMPSDEGATLAAVSRRLSDSELTRSLVLTVGAARPEDARAAARDLAARLRPHPEVARARIGMDEEALAALEALYLPHRHGFLSDAPEDPDRGVAARLTEEALRARARAVRRELALPGAPFVERLAARDPLGAFRALLERFRELGRGMPLQGGQFVSRDGRHAVVLVQSRASPFDAAASARLLEGLDAAWAAVVSERGDPSLVLDRSGVHRFAVEVEADMQRDMLRIMAVSFVGVAALFLLFFRSPAVFGLAATPAVLGILAATTLGVARGGMDALTLAFGACLIGVAIDYAVHLLNHHGLAAGEPPAATARRLRAPIVLGAGTTMASFAGLTLTSFPGFRDIGVFAIVGIGVALLATLFLLPGWMAARRPLPRRSHRTADAMARGLALLRRRRRAVAAITLVACLAAVPGLLRLVWVDDLSRLTKLDPGLLAEDRRVRERVSQFDASRFVVVEPAPEAVALARNDAVAARLEALVERGALEGVRSLHALLWSPELQRRNLEALAAEPDVARRVEEAFAAEGFRPGALAPFADDLAQPAPPPLRLDDLRDSPLGELVSSLAVPVDGQVAVVTHLRGVRSEEAVAEALEGVPGVRVFDQRAFIDEIYGAFRTTTLEQIAVGSLLVVVVLLLRYRRVRPAAAAFLPSALTALLLLGGFGWLGVEANLLHAVSLILVMGMGVDYGIFLVDSARDRDGAGATLLSLLLSCLTTVFVFGSLALSSHGALRAMGLTTGGGILLSFLLAPASWAILSEEDPA